MDRTYLAIENDLKLHERESTFWQSKGVSSIRVSSMSEGIEIAARKQFLYIGINAGNVYYESSLSLLRDVTNDPVFMATEYYTIQEQALVTKLGADLYGELGKTSGDNYNAVMAQIDYLHSRVMCYKPPTKLVYHRNILISERHRLTLLEDREVELTTIEFDILNLLISNRDYAFIFKELYDLVWRSKYDKSANNAIRNAIARLREKICDYDEKNRIIQSLRNVGFKCPANDRYIIRGNHVPITIN